MVEAIWLLYGAYGYTGRLIARRAVERGHRPVVAGRDEAKTRALAQELGLEARVFSLDDPVALRFGLAGVDLVLHSAGPFASTWRAMTEACLAERCHYLDVTGEIDVLEGMQGLSSRVEDAGLTFVPAVGFDVVPTDCAAAMAAEALPDATELDLAFQASGRPSRGTARTAVSRMGGGSALRRGGKIVPIPMGSVRREIPFADKPRMGVAIPWGDVSSAFRTTGIPDIRVFTVLPPRVAKFGRLAGPLMSLPGVRGAVTRWVDRRVHGPDDEELAHGFARVWAEVRDARGNAVTVELRTPNGYTLTARTAVAAVERVLSGRTLRGPGVWTPANAFGSGFALEVEGVERVR